jgi:hypothetical protein
VARAAGGARWRELLDAVREAVWRLEATGQVTVFKGGRPVSQAQARGPIGIGRRAVAASGNPDAAAPAAGA